jgi:KaiC/GvpD/RAD55 family RecA-like ATPase
MEHHTVRAGDTHMVHHDRIRAFYLEHIPGARIEENILRGMCPLCSSGNDGDPGTIVAYLDPESYFIGYFRCLSRCVSGGFPPHFARLMGLELHRVPDYDTDREPYVRDMLYPPRNLNAEIKKFRSLMGQKEYGYFEEFGISRSVLKELQIGYNGRYLVYPYFLEDGNCYAARCLFPGKEDDHFWHGNERFFAEEFRIFNVQEIERCEDGALFITDGENNLLSLKELGYPGIAIPSVGDLENLDRDRLAYVKHIFMALNHSPEAELSARSLATRLGFKARILKWPSHLRRGYHLVHLAKERGKGLRSVISSMIKTSKSFSPFPPPDKEHQRLFRLLQTERGKELLGLSTGFAKLDSALNGIRGINVMGGQPKTGKSCFFMQISTEAALRKSPVIYYDFENGRRKIYTRTLCRLSRLTEKEIRLAAPGEEASEKLAGAHKTLGDILHYFRVITDRRLDPDIMRRHIDFLQHETQKDYVLVVVDSLHKLPFKNLSERRTGIDEWLRHMEAIRDEQNAAFLVVSELSRDEKGHYAKRPDLGSFKESGDIEYSADNAMILCPDWDILEPISSKGRTSTLWLVASRENSPGKIAEYSLQYPFWGFEEV